MATLTIRNLPDPVREKLRIRAAKAGRSMEAEAREILARGVSVAPPSPGSDKLQQMVHELYERAPAKSLVQELIRERRREAINEIIENGDDPKVVFGKNFRGLCRDAELTPADIKRMIKAHAKLNE
jgi:plasmid stability protein